VTALRRARWKRPFSRASRQPGASERAWEGDYDEPKPFKVFSVTDIHGSEICWRKFLNAGTFHQADRSGLDEARAWTNLNMKAGGRAMQPVGSKSVRTAIERVQPLLGLHGHIHESRGAVRIGRTLALNPGSSYGEGVLQGALTTLDPKSQDKDYVVGNG
jgi:Icc-related predicted phosphoesterase